MQPTPPTTQKSNLQVTFSAIPKPKGHKIILYGTGGIGKTTLGCLAPGKVGFIDLEESLGILSSQLKEAGIEIPLSAHCNDWPELRQTLQSSGWEKVNTIVIDSGTKAQEMAEKHTIKTVKHEKGQPVSSIEGYGFGKGFQFVFDTFLPLLGDLDRHAREGRNIIIICHECTSNVPNPRGEDYLRYEPRLQNPKSGNASIRLRLKEWADHVLFLGYDVVVDDKGVAKGHGSRTLYSAELPFCMAKSRTTSEQIPIELGVSPWEQIIK
ncbi:MAG: AAA family ATPase [Patescibacteria group bacterium]|nr:AAA family ATPase [Patescibacteria group bacterium]